MQLLRATDCLTPHDGLRPMVYRTLFGLIAAAGLRLSEALNLTISDVDLAAGAVTIRQTKFRKSRCLPLHSSVVQALDFTSDPATAVMPPTPVAVLRISGRRHASEEDGRERLPAPAASS